VACGRAGYFLTKIFHPNIRQPSGEICVNTLKKDWQPTHGIRHILKVIRCLLIQPFPDSALNEEAAKLLLEDYEEFAKYARMLTSVHARPLETISAEVRRPRPFSSFPTDPRAREGRVTRSAQG
jgi:hypothetical protein